MRYSRHIRTEKTKEDQENIDKVVLFVQEYFRFNRADKIMVIILAIIVLVGHFWLGYK